MRRSLARNRQLPSRFPYGIAKQADLIALGIPRSTISMMCRPGGPWRTVLLGQVKMSNGSLNESERRHCTLVHAGEGAMFTGLTGARLHGVKALPDDDRIHVLIPADRHVSSRDFALVTRTTRPPKVRSVNGLPVAPLARCIVDAATRMDDVDKVRALMADAVQRQLCAPADLADELSEPRRPGTALARSVLAEIMIGVRSATEAWAHVLIRRSDLPEPTWNVELRTLDGRVLGVVDVYWEEVGLALEIQSRSFHLSPESLERDTQKAADLAAVGIRLVPIMGSDLRRRPGPVLRQIREAYDHAAGGPSPLVTATLHRPA